MEPAESFPFSEEGSTGTQRSKTQSHFNRVINVVSREDSASLECLPSYGSPSLSSRYRSRLLDQQSRSRSLTDVTAGQKKSTCFLRGRKYENRVLPSCQANQRRSPLGRLKSLSPTPSTCSEQSAFSKGRDNSNTHKNCPIDIKCHKRNKSDSFLVPNKDFPSLSASADEDLRAMNDSISREFLGGSDNDRLSLKPNVFPESETVRYCESVKDHFLGIPRHLRPHGRRRRNCSESEIFETSSSDTDISKCRPEHRSLQSLTREDDVTLFSDTLYGSAGGTEINAESQEWDSRLNADFRLGSMENLKQTQIKWCGSNAESDDDLNVSWSSCERISSFGSSPSCSADDSDMFSCVEDMADDNGSFQNKVKPEQSCTELVSDYASKAHAHNLIRSKENANSSQHITETNTDTDLLRSECKETCHTTSSAMISASPSTQLSPEIIVNSVISGQGNGQSAPVGQYALSTPNNCVTASSACDEQSSVLKSECSSFVLLPHLQRTLQAVRKHIKSRKTSSKSKIPVRVKQQISPRRHRNQSRNVNTSRRNSRESPAKDLFSEQDLIISDHMSSSSSSVLDAEITEDCTHSATSFSQQFGHMGYTLTLVKTPEVQNVTAPGSNTPASLVSATFKSDDKFSVFSPRPPRILIQPNDTASANNSGCQSEARPTVDHISVTLHDQFQSSPKTISAVAEDKESPASSESVKDSPRSSKDFLSPRSSSEESSPRRQKRKTSSRVQHLLTNDLFKKNLSGHFDLVERNIFHIKKFGLKKSFSNLDLTISDSERLQAAFDSSLKQEDAEFEKKMINENCAWNSSHDGTSNPDGASSCLQSSKAPGTHGFRSKAADASQTPRRKSLACDDPSLHQLRDFLRQGQPIPSIALAPAKRGRMYIPSYDEFRKQRYKAAVKTLHGSADGVDTSDGVSTRPPDEEAINYRLLHPIAEDDGIETTRLMSKRVETRGLAEGSKVGNDEQKVMTLKARTVPQNATQIDKRTVVVGQTHGSVGKDGKTFTGTRSSQHYAKHKSTSQVTSGDKNFGKAYSTHNQTPRFTQTVDHTHRALATPPDSQDTPKTSSEPGKTVGVSRTADETKAVNMTQNDTGEHDQALYCKAKNLPDVKKPQVFLNDLPKALFNAVADALDTESWAQLFMETHTPRRKNDTRKGSGHRWKRSRIPLAPVLRSSSDVTGQLTVGGASGQRQRRHRKERPYKSDPLADGAGSLGNGNSSRLSRQQGVLGVVQFLEEGVDKGDSQTSSFPSLEELTEESSAEDCETDNDKSDEGRRKQRWSSASSASEDSGVMGQDGTTSSDPAPGHLVPTPYHHYAPPRTKLQMVCWRWCKPCRHTTHVSGASNPKKKREGELCNVPCPRICLTRR